MIPITVKLGIVESSCAVSIGVGSLEKVGFVDAPLGWKGAQSCFETDPFCTSFPFAAQYGPVLLLE